MRIHIIKKYICNLYKNSNLIGKSDYMELTEELNNREIYILNYNNMGANCCNASV